MSLGESRCERQHGEEIFPLKILIVGDDLVNRHAGTEQLKQTLNGVAKPADAGLAMADCRIDRDSLKKLFHFVTIPGSGDSGLSSAGLNSRLWMCSAG